MADARIEIEAEDGGLDAFLASPDGQGPRPPILLLPDRQGVTAEVEAIARRLCARGYVVLAPEWTLTHADDRREAAEAWLDHLADARGVDDRRIGVLGLGAGADLALRVAAWRAERISAVAAFGGRGFAPRTAQDIAQRINAVLRLGYRIGAASTRFGALETALCAAGVDFDVEIYEREPAWPDLLDLFARALETPQVRSAGFSSPVRNPWAT